MILQSGSGVLSAVGVPVTVQNVRATRGRILQYDLEQIILLYLISNRRCIK